MSAICEALALAVASVAFLAGVVSYLKMMRGVPLEVQRLHMRRLRVRGNLLFVVAPELFTGVAATYRRRYIGALLVFAIALLAYGVLDALSGR